MSAVIAIPERFDFSFHQAFTQQYNDILAKHSGIVISLDFRQVLYLDSAALGMIVLLQKRAKSVGCSVAVINAKGTALEVLEIANFDKMITINP